MAAKRELRRSLKSLSDLDPIEQRWVFRELPKVDRDLLRRIVYDTVGNPELRSTQTNKPSVFLSHSSKDKPFVRALAQRLKKAGIRVWLDEAEIRVGESLIEKLGAALDGVDFLIVVLSRSSVRSRWVQREVEIAMNHEIKRRRVKVIPILKETVKLPTFLEGKVYLDFRDKSKRSRAGEKLIRDLLSY